MSALQVYGVPSSSKGYSGEENVVEDKDKEAFRAHVDALFADVL